MNEGTINRVRVLLAVTLIAAAALLVGRVAADGPPRPGNAGGGEMYRRSEEGFERLPLLELDVAIEVTGIVSHGVLKQRFHNPTNETIEAVYVFPLPERAAVHAMEVQLGDRIIRSVVREKEDARRRFEEARVSGRKAALVEQEKPNLFQTSVAGIGPDQEIVVSLEYVDEVTYSDGEFEIAFPLTFTPRYNPASPVETPPFVEGHHQAAPTVTFHAGITAGMPLKRVWSESHSLRITPSAERWDVQMEASLLIADRDLLVRWEARSGERTVTALMTEERDEGNYALVMIVPPIPEGKIPDGMKTETLFVIDVSGSMDGPSIVQARQALLAAIDRLRPDDRFNILRFNNSNSPFREEFSFAKGEAVSGARAWIRRLEAVGGTEIYPALLRAISMFGPRHEGTVQRIVFLTDGAVGNEEEMLERVARGLGEIRLHMVGIGSAPNRYLMREMAAMGRGICEFVNRTDQAENLIDRFFARLGRPVMTELMLEWHGAEPVDVNPSRLPDLHAGEPLFLSASFAPGLLPRSATLTGMTPLGEVRSQIDASSTERGGRGIATRWARSEVDQLMNRRFKGDGDSNIRPAVIEIGLRHKLVTPYTSFVAVEERITVENGQRTVRVANALPHGSRIGPELPRGGTGDRLIRLTGIILGAAGLAGLLVSRRGGA